MEVFKSIIWSKEDSHYLKQLDKWMSLCEREELELTEVEIKAAARFARGWGERMSADNITESHKVWQKIHEKCSG